MSKKVRATVVVAVFLLAAMWFFFPVGRPDEESLLFAMRLALPAFMLALGGIGLISWRMMIGFLCCAIGDVMGVSGIFEGQMTAFALAHIYFIFYFIRSIRRSKPKPAVFVVTTLFCLVPLVFAVVSVIPAVQEVPIRVGCSVYALLLTGTLWTAIVRAFSGRNSKRVLPYIAALGALLFLVSDFILSWNKFVEHIPDASLFIMVPYYAALLLLFIGTLRLHRHAYRSRRAQRTR